MILWHQIPGTSVGEKELSKSAVFVFAYTLFGFEDIILPMISKF